MTALTLTKHHGLGNDFLIAIDPPTILTSAHAMDWCDRHRGVGADGLIIATLPSPGAEHDWDMVLYNADGSRAEISGNGIRCLGQALADHLGLGQTELSVSTDAGVRLLQIDAAEGATRQVRVDMGAPQAGPGDFADWASTGVEPKHQTSIDMGNPHLVALVDAPESIDLAVVGAAVEAAYPAGLNVHFVEVDAPNHINLFVWERGAGITEACGSGACAAAVATARWKLTDGAVTVLMPGGSAVVEVTDTVHLTGPTTFVATVVVDHG